MADKAQAVSVEALRIEGAGGANGRSIKERIKERVACEHTLVVVDSDRIVARMQYLPGQERELATGFLVTEALVSPTGGDGLPELEIRSSEDHGQLVTEARLMSAIGPEKLDAFQKNASLASGCGAALYGLKVDPLDCGRRIDMSFRIEASVISAGMRRFRSRSELYRLTGCVHSASVADARGEEVAFAEDIGRHNALDKAVGSCALRGITLADKIVLVSGRLSSELAAKCVRAGVALAASPGAPTDLALRIAKATGLTLIGFARADRMNVYSAEWRLT